MGAQAAAEAMQLLLVGRWLLEHMAAEAPKALQLLQEVEIPVAVRPGSGDANEGSTERGPWASEGVKTTSHKS